MKMPTLYREFATQQEIDEAYDPARTALDVASIRRHFAAQSELARKTLDLQPDVLYGPTLEEYVDVFPSAVPGSPVLVFLHGGYWRSNSARDFSCVALGPAALGMTVVVVNYALCPWVTLDEITRQARASVAWAWRNAARYNGDPKRIVVAGHSAGAHLAAMCLQTPWARAYGIDDDCLRAALLVSGIYDIAPLRYSYLQPLIQLDEGVIRRNSPMFGVSDCKARALLTWGSRESAEFERQSAEFHERWTQAGNVGECLVQEGADHFTAIQGFENSDSPLCRWFGQVA